MEGMTVQAIEKSLKKQIGTIGEAVSRVKAGIIMNIDDVEEQVARICTQISALPQEEAQSLEPIMAEMIGQLEALAAALSEFQNRKDDGAD